MTAPDRPIPKWREDFPYESEADDVITRREFIRFLGVVSGGLAVGNGVLLANVLLGEEQPGARVDVCAADALQPGAWLVFRYPDDHTPAILIHRESGEWVSFLQKCPHLSCPVAYEPATEQRGEHLSCHCHNGSFEIETGRGATGPPRELRPLRRVLLAQEDGRIVATGLQEIRFKPHAA
jgi:nitrite reductase/ring-hydroxylating ferredoxin subunit